MTDVRESNFSKKMTILCGACLLKKARCLDSSREAHSAPQKTQIVLELRQQHAMSNLLKAAGLARSTFYYQQKVIGVQDKYVDLKRQIQTIYARHKGRYGYRRITVTLHQLGHMINHKTVQRLMRELHIKSLVRPKKYRSYRGTLGRTAPNLLQRAFSAQRPNEKWVTDVTQFNVAGEKLYLSPVMDLYNGEIIAYQTALRPTFDMISSMLEKAWMKLKLKGLSPVQYRTQPNQA